MSRVIVGVMAANLAAPILYLLFIELFSPGLFSGGNDFLGIIIGAVFFTVFLLAFPLSVFFALLGWFLRWRSSWAYVLSSVAVGMIFALFMNDGQLRYPVHHRRFFIAAGIGLICGWIYWSIALRGQPHDAERPQLGMRSS
jgi:hypothetical protein